MADKLSEKDEQLQDVVEKEKVIPEKSFFERMPPAVLIGGAFLIFMALKSMNSSTESDPFNVWLVIGVLALMYFLSKQSPASQGILSPKEAELHVMKEVDRKIRWKMWHPHSEYKIGPGINAIHRDARGMYYDLPLTVYEPFVDVPLYYNVKCYMSGPEKAMVNFIESIGRPTLREIDQERTILPKMFDFAKRSKNIDFWLGKYLK